MPKILLVEDDPLIARMMIRAFRLAGGYELEHADNGRKGLEKARAFMPDLILLDMMMPEMNGLEVLERLQADEGLRSIPVLVMTNLVGDQNVVAATNRGAVGYLIKSDLDPDQIAPQAQAVLDRLKSKKEQ